MPSSFDEQAPNTRQLQRNIAGLSDTPLPSYDLPDLLCAPGHEFIFSTTRELFRYGSQGLENAAEDFDEDLFFESLIRGAGHLNVFTMMLAAMGKYIIHLWLIRSWFLPHQSGAYPHVGEAQLGLAVFDWEGMADVEIPVLGHLVFESWWVHRFLGMAISLGVSYLNLVPLYWIPMKGNKIVKDSGWLQAHKELQGRRDDFPYGLKMHQSAHGPRIHAIPNPMAAEALIERTISEMCEHERSIRFLLEEVSKSWELLLSFDRLDDQTTNELLHGIMVSQVLAWPQGLKGDSKLKAAIAARRYSQDKTNPAAKARVEELDRALDRAQDSSCGYGRGYRQLPEKELDEKAQKRIDSILPELQEFFTKFAWPVKDQEQQEKAANKHTWTCLSPKDWDFVWEQYGERSDRYGFCAAIVQRYLERTISRSYGLDPILLYTRQFVAALPKSKRVSSSPKKRKPSVK